MAPTRRAIVRVRRSISPPDGSREKVMGDHSEGLPGRLNSTSTTLFSRHHLPSGSGAEELRAQRLLIDLARRS